MERLYTAFDALDKKQDEYKAEVERALGKREIFDVARKPDKEMRAMIDEALDAEVCGTLFGSMNVYAMAGGLPVWANLMLSIMDQVDSSLAGEQAKTDSRIKKYTSKYHR